MKTEQYLREKGIQFEHHVHRPAYTAQELAAEEHVPGKEVAKPVVVKLDDRYVMCVLPASHKLDMTKLCEVENAHDCRLAEENEMASLFPDVEIGAEPPFGNLYDLPTLVDRNLAEDERILFAAGSHRESIEMGYADFDELVHPRVADISIHI